MIKCVKIRCEGKKKTPTVFLNLILLPPTLPGMLPVHPAGAAARYRPPAGCSGEGKGGGGRAGRPAVATTASFAAAQQFATPPNRGQGRAV